jgi:protein ImuB
MALNSEEKRLCCVDVPALPLQCLVRREPELATLPAVIVDELQPQGVVLWSNRAARTAGVRTGARYGHALSLCAQLRAGLVTDAEQQTAISDIAELLRTFTPLVEPARQEPGVFWLDANGLSRFFRAEMAGPDLPLPEIHARWADAIRQKLLEQRWYAAVVLGFDRLATYAIARHFRGVRVFADPAHEAQTGARVHLASLGSTWGIVPKLRDELERLGVETLGDLAKLPETALRERMGLQVAMLRRRLAHDVPMPLAAELPQPEPIAARDFEPADDNSERLLFAAKGLLAQLLPMLVARRQAVAKLELLLVLDVSAQTSQPLVLQPAEPTLQELQLLDLVRLALDRTPLAAAVKTLRLQLHGVPATAEQLALWQLQGQRDPHAGALALARLRALFGDDAVVAATLRSAWLPEGQFAWQPLRKLRIVKARVAAEPENVIRLPQQPRLQVVRRLLTQPARLPPRPHGNRPWRLAPFRQETVVHFDGPYRLAGGWWRSISQTDRCRDYGYATTDRGTVLWIFHEPARDAWFCHGFLE